MPPVSMIPPEGGAAVLVPETEAAAYQSAGFRLESAEQASGRAASEQIHADNTTIRAQVKAGAQAVLRGGSVGLTDVAQRLAGGEEAARELRDLREHNPGISTVGEVVGSVISPAGKLGKAAGATRGTGAIARIGGAARAGAVEGGIQGLGYGASELALSEEPLTVERLTATLSSNMLYGAGIGAAAGTVAKGAEIGLMKGRAALDEVAARYSTRANVGDDLASLDAKGLKAAETAEREAIEAARVPQRAELAEEITAFRRELKQQKHFLTTKDVDLPAVGDKLGSKELGRIAAKANKQLDNILDNPVGVAKNPAKALDALQRQENALAKLAERTDDLRQVFAADTSGARAAALDTIAPALERNRALQQKIAGLTSEAASPRLAQIAEARDALMTGGRGRQSLAEQMAGSTVFSAVTGAVAAIPLPGTSMLAPMLGAKAAGLVTDKVFGRLGKAMSEGQARSAAAIGKVFEKASRGVRRSAPVATKILTAVAFAPGDRHEGKRTLPDAYRQRSTELREQVASDMTGKPVVRPQARQRIAKQLAPIAAMQPHLADKMESLAVRRLEFLAAKLPRRPEVAGIQIGPDRWQPSDMQMRTWARYVAAAEDPDGIIERLADGAVTPEDAEVMRELYPEQLADITRQILERLPTLSQTLPYHRRLALSMLTGVPVDPSMDPRILATLQAPFVAEPEPPKPAPQFGSVKATETGTPSQRREQGA